MIESIIAFVSPFAVRYITSFVKNVADRFARIPEGVRVSMLRLLVAVFSFLAVVAKSAITNGEIDPASIHTLVDTIVTFFAASGIYLIGKVRKA